MTSPAPTVDMSLPDYGTLVARAGVNPDAEAARVASASPAAVAGAGTAFGRAGGEFDGAFTRSMGAASTLGTGFTNDGAAVYDRGTHLGNLPAGFGDAGTRLAGTSRRLSAVADDLDATMAETSSAVSGLHGELAQLRSGWAARVAAAASGPGGLIPEAAVGALLAERDRVAAAMVDRVAQVGRAVSTRIQGYEVVVHDALQLLADQGFVRPEELDTPAPAAPRLEGGVDPTGFGTPLTAGYAADPVNTALGNFVEVETDLPYAGALAGLSFARTYNSCADRDGPFGPRWSSWATARLAVGTWTAEFEGPDGQRVAFPRTGPDAFGRAAGVDALVERSTGGAEWVLAWFDGSRWEFDRSGRIAATWAGPGTGVVFVHDEDGRLVELAHERGRRVRLEWDGARIVALTGSDGRRVDYRYAGALLSAVDGPAGERRYDHDAGGRVVSVTDADGVVELVNTYDPAGRVLTQRSPFGRTVTFTYAADGSTVVADDAAGPRNVYRHDREGRLVAVTDGHGNTQHRRFDRWGSAVEVVARGGAATRRELDERAHPTRLELPGEAVLELAWDDRDRVVEARVSGPDVATAVTTLRYDGRERIPAEIVDPEGGVTRFTVAGGLVTAVTDADGVTVRYRHDAEGQVVAAVDAAGGVTRMERDPAGRPTAVTTPAGRRTELAYDGAGRLVEHRDPAGGVWRYSYTAAGRLAAVVDPTGARREARHGAHGEATELVDALGAVTGLRFDALGNLVGVAGPDGAKAVFTHDALCRVTAWSGPAGGTWVREYDVDGNPTATVDPTGVREDRGYDGAGRLAGVDDGLVAVHFRHDALGRRIAEVRADDTAREVEYDRCGRPVRITDPDGGVTRLSYTAAGRPAAVVSPAGRTQRWVHDDRGWPTTLLDGNQQAWWYRYDPDGLLVERISPTGLAETLTRDEAGRVVRHRVPGRGTTTYGYDAAGWVVTVADRDGRRELVRDAAGRMVAATDALGHTTRYAYDAGGRPVAVTDPLGHTTHYGYDEAGRLLAGTDPLGRTTRHDYDPAGRLRERRTPDGTVWTIDHDGSGRRRRVTAVRAAERVVVTVDRDALGRPVRVAEAGAAPVELRRDRAGRLVQRRRGDQVVGWAYDADGLPVAVHNPDGTTTGRRRDGAGRVTAIEHPLLGCITLARDADGRLLEMRDAAAVARWTYAEGWLTGHDVVSGAGRRSTRLTRDEHGRVVVADTDGRPTVYGYDAAGQLRTAADATGEYRVEYDPAGRPAVEAWTGAGARHHRHDPAGQLQTITGSDGECRFGYDGCGRRTTADGPAHARRVVRDPLGRPTAVSTTSGDRTRTVALDVDALGELAAVDGVPLAWDSVDPVGPPVAIGATTVVGHGHPWALAGHRGPVALVPDRQHTPSGWIGDPWGAAAAEPAIGLGYRGELTVDGLVWLRNRAYDPAARAFLEPDPLPPVPGTACAANPYHYAGNDPVNALDPLGLRPLTDADLTAFRYAGGALALPGTAAPDAYHGLSLVNGLLTTADAVGGASVGSLLELDAAIRKANGRGVQLLAQDNLTRLAQVERGPGDPARFYGDVDHYRAMAQRGSGLVADAERVERASKVVPIRLSGALAVAGIGYDIATGKPPVQAVASGAGGFLASVGAGAATGALIGSFVPIPGVGTAAGALAGAVAGTFTSGAIDSLFENGLDPGKAIGRGVEAVTDTAGAVSGGIAAAAHGIAGLFD